MCTYKKTHIITIVRSQNRPLYIHTAKCNNSKFKY